MGPVVLLAARIAVARVRAEADRVHEADRTTWEAERAELLARLEEAEGRQRDQSQADSPRADEAIGSASEGRQAAAPTNVAAPSLELDTEMVPSNPGVSLVIDPRAFFGASCLPWPAVPRASLPSLAGLPVVPSFVPIAADEDRVISRVFDDDFVIICADPASQARVNLGSLGPRGPPGTPC